ncbi:unnamed protein product [Brassica oleracea]
MPHTCRALNPCIPSSLLQLLPLPHYRLQQKKNHIKPSWFSSSRYYYPKKSFNDAVITFQTLERIREP